MIDLGLKNWKYKKLGNICKTSSGGTPSRKKKSFYDGEIPWVKSGELNFNTIRDTEEKVSEKGIKESSAKLFPKGTLLIALYGATVGKLAFLGIDATTNQAVCAIMPENGLDSKYLYWYLFSKRKDLVGKSIGGAQPNISQAILKDIDVPVPPLPIQNRIVEKIEELFSELDHGVKNLKKAQQQLKTYRQSVLKDALEGDWDNVKVNDVCERVKVGVVIKPKQYYTEKSEGIPAFRSANVREFRVEDSNWVYFTKEGHDINERTQLNEGDVLLVRSGYPGTSCVVPKKYEGTNAIDILIAEPNKELVLSEYLCVFNNSPLGKGLFLSGSRGVAQKHLNVGVYKNLELPLPPLHEQERIVSQVEARLSIVEKLEHIIKENLQKTEALRQSILKKAFSGELVKELI